MTLVRFSPMRDMMTLQNELNRIFNAAPVSNNEEYESATWSPLADVIEDHDKYTIQLDMPGMTKEHVKLNFKENVLTVSGERKSAEVKEGITSHREERVYGKFVRTFSFRTPVNPEKIDAKFTDGVLSITVPKAEEAKPKQIEIH